MTPGHLAAGVIRPDGCTLFKQQLAQKRACWMQP